MPSKIRPHHPLKNPQCHIRDRRHFTRLAISHCTISKLSRHTSFLQIALYATASAFASVSSESAAIHPDIITIGMPGPG